jgi:hypothetical protein
MSIFKIENAQPTGQFYYGMIEGDYPSQFKTTRKNVNVYMFQITEITNDGIAIASPMDSLVDVIPFEKASKIKAVGGDILKVSVYEPLTKKILIDAMDADIPAIVTDTNLIQYAVRSFSMRQGGVITVDLDNGTSVSMYDLYVLDRTLIFGK